MAPKQAKAASGPGMSDAAVQTKTGKSWSEWFAILDAAGARKMNHARIAAHLHEMHGCAGWWCQMIAVGYERERGLRVKNQSCTGDFQVSSNKTIEVSLRKLYQAWADEKTRADWLKDPHFTVRKATANKSMRITWIDDQTSVEANFYAKGDKKSQISLQHRKLADAKAVERWRAYWSAQLERLKALLEG